MPTHRRTFLKTAAAAAAVPLVPNRSAAAAPDDAASTHATSPPVRKLTRGPKFHWFGYYDKWQFSLDDTLCLGMEVGFEGRSPRPDDEIEVGMINLADNDAWTPLGTTTAWSWQQGCMLQWLPQEKPSPDPIVVYNIRQSDRFASVRLNVRTGQSDTLPAPINAVTPDGLTAVSADFRRIQDMRPGYGYAGLVDPYRDDMAPKETGISRLDLQSGQVELVLSLAEIAAFDKPHPTMSGAKHYANHLLCGPDGKRFVFLHRWRPDGGKGPFMTRMLTANLDGSDLFVLDPSGHTSHFIWRDAEHVLAWTRPKGRPDGFYLFRDKTDAVVQVGARAMPFNGHCTYLPLPGAEWILNDTYPRGPQREQTVYLYHVPTHRRIDLGAFPAPPRYTGEWRCDTHPRYSRDGTKVCIDSTHGGDGRQLYLIDIAEIVAGKK